MDLSLVYFPSAVTIGALHALEPGHAKTLTAAYLIGTKGTKRDATLLGLSVAATHSLVVIGLSIAAVFLGKAAFTDEATYYLAVGSSVVVIVLGTWMLNRRLKALRRANALCAHSHTPDPVIVRGAWFEGTVEIIDTPAGERFCVTTKKDLSIGYAKIEIERGSKREIHELIPVTSKPDVFISSEVPAEPHEFRATLYVSAKSDSEALGFEVHEPEHHHDHALLSDDEHARAHAATLPEYVQRGERPTVWQILAFGAAGGLVPCPAAVSVMLLSLSVSQSGKGLILVLGFSLGLALTLVGVGLLIVTGVSKLSSTGKLSWLSALAPAIAAGMVILSGSVGLIVAITKHS